MTNYSFGEGDHNSSVHEYLQFLQEHKPKGLPIKSGDTIEYVSNNQLGYMKYKIIKKSNGFDIKVIADIDGPISRSSESSNKKRSRSSKSSRSSQSSRSTNKSSSKSSQRKTKKQRGGNRK